MELFVLGLVVGVGAAKRKAITKAVVKGYMSVSERTKDVMTHVREDMRDAVEEAQNERHEHEIASNIAPEMLTEAAVEGESGQAGSEGHFDASDHADPRPSTRAGSSQKPGVGILRGIAKAFLTVSEKTRSTSAQLREEMRDAVEEARYEHEISARKKGGASEEHAAAENADEAPARSRKTSTAAAPKSKTARIAAASPKPKTAKSSAKTTAEESGPKAVVKRRSAASRAANNTESAVVPDAASAVAEA